jgi:predicted permease
MGIPLFLTAFGPEGALPAIVGTLVSFTLFLGGTIAALEAARAVGPSFGLIVQQVSRVLVKVPLLVAPFLGMGFSALGIPIPKAAGNFLDLLGNAAGPAALFALGLSLVAQNLKGDAGEVAWLTLVKLVLHPCLVWVAAFHVFDMPTLWREAAVILAALPVGALVFVVAQQYDVFVQRASTAIVASTALSVATISALLVWFESM